jgi:predicted phosphodiesterase
MQRIALISDIHGNEIALRAVLDDARRAGVDGIACLGDVATLGPRPRQVLQLLREHCHTFILGNHDEYMLAPELALEYAKDPALASAIAWCRAELEQDDLAFLRGFSRLVELPLGAAGSLLLFHGSPASNEYDLLAETPEAELVAQLASHRASVLTGGHTHIQMLRQHRGQLLVNPGSVGLPFERFVHHRPPTVLSHAEYGIVESSGRSISVSLRRVALDRAALAEAARSWDSPLASFLVAQYERS